MASNDNSSDTLVCAAVFEPRPHDARLTWAPRKNTPARSRLPDPSFAATRDPPSLITKKKHHRRRPTVFLPRSGAAAAGAPLRPWTNTFVRSYSDADADIDEADEDAQEPPEHA